MMTVTKYCVTHFLGGGCSLLCYLLCPGMFRGIGELGRAVSVLILFTLVVIGETIGLCITLRNRRTRAGVFRNTVLPLGVYTVVSYYGEQKAAVLTLGLILTILILLFVAEDAGRKGGGLEELMEDVPLAVGVWTIVSLGLTALMGVFAYEGMFEWLREMI